VPPPGLEVAGAGGERLRVPVRLRRPDAGRDAVASAQRLSSLPDVPTVAETLPGFEAVAWYAIVAPPGTPKAITAKINADVNEALAEPGIRERLKKLSAEVYGGSPEKAADYMREEVNRWADVIKKANIKLE